MIINALGFTNLTPQFYKSKAVEHLLGKYAHLDSTSFVLQREYAAKTDMPTELTPDDTEVIEVVHGYSKDHRPDLKQVMLSLSVSGLQTFRTTKWQ